MTDPEVARTRATSFVNRLPRDLRETLAKGRWLPVLGAGLSACATTSDGRRPPVWGELGRRFADLVGISSTNPIDSLSTYAAYYRRAYLIERLYELLLIDDVETSEVHRRFAQLPFEIVVTTNVDFLLDRAYAEQRRPCVPMIGESQLAISRRQAATYLLKLHGDLNHPNDLVVTEEDYDGFLERNPVLATFLSSAFLTSDPVLIGYSLDDADLREILTLLRERLGRMTRPIWAILACDPDNTASRFERRGVTPVVLDPGAPREKRPEILADFFEQLRSEWERAVGPLIDARLDASTAELQRNSGIAPQLALFAANRSTSNLLRDFVFPAVPRAGFIPLGIDDVRARDVRVGPMVTDIALAKAAAVVYDTAPGNPVPLDYVAARRGDRPLIIVTDRHNQRSRLVAPDMTLSRPAEMSGWDLLTDELVVKLQQWRALEPPSLAGLNDDREVLLTSLALLEAQLRGADAPADAPTVMAVGGRMHRLRSFFDTDFDAIVNGVRLRHDLLQDLPVPPKELKESAHALSAVAVERGVAR
ncbi:SIR2 family NAD-dependent protein deacylase [Actinomycetospora cinnamomea]|uniref:SIR2-like protein n=1 Tax=Actinomycetospora cinnamomea TaxID=663609 RepID=A0A2U1F876_9PSEU|nr:SIR2 family protein [Actinomycetospora cinnamomea]PVZ08180.1 SIR2-like protein [Actinomycetospora cinnamomea]